MSEPAKNAKATLQDLTNQITDFTRLVERIEVKRHAGLAMVVAAALDRILEDALRTKMKPLNSDWNRKMFGDSYGLLGDFSRKIDLAFALGLIDTKIHGKLTTIRNIRNKFAHADGYVDFTTPTIRELVPNLFGTSPMSIPQLVGAFLYTAREIESAVCAPSGLPNQGMIDKIKAGYS